MINHGGVWTLEGGMASGKWTLSSDQKTLTMTMDNYDIRKMIGTITKLTDTDLWIDVKTEESTDYLFAVVSFEYASTLKFTRKK